MVGWLAMGNGSLGVENYISDWLGGGWLDWLAGEWLAGKLGITFQIENLIRKTILSTQPIWFTNQNDIIVFEIASIATIIFLFETQNAGSKARVRWEYVECTKFWTNVCAKDNTHPHNHEHASRTCLMQSTSNYLKGIIPRWLGVIPCRQGVIPSRFGIRGFLYWLTPNTIIRPLNTYM